MNNYKFANIELNEETMQKVIAQLVVENANIKRKIDRLNNIINKAKEYIKEWQRFPHTNGSTHKELENLMKILDKELKENKNG